MTEIKNIGRMEQILISGIAAIITTYLAGGTFLDIELPSIIAWILALLVAAYFLNRMWLKVEHYVDTLILIMKLRAEQERETLRGEALSSAFKQLMSAPDDIAKKIFKKVSEKMKAEREEEIDG